MGALCGGRVITFLILFFFSVVVKAQEGVYIQGAIDPKMVIIGDEGRGIKKGTLDLSARIMMEAQQQKYGYWVVFPEFTYRSTEGILKTYTANVGYTLNTVIPQSEVGITLGYGWIDHYGMSTKSFVTTQSYAFKINKIFKMVLVSELRDRTDLKYLYGKGKMGWTFRVGLEVKIL